METLKQILKGFQLASLKIITGIINSNRERCPNCGKLYTEKGHKKFSFEYSVSGWGVPTFFYEITCCEKCLDERDTINPEKVAKNMASWFPEERLDDFDIGKIEDCLNDFKKLGPRIAHG